MILNRFEGLNIHDIYDLYLKQTEFNDYWTFYINQIGHDLAYKIDKGIIKEIME